jgi:transcription antitermination factor NusG
MTTARRPRRHVLWYLLLAFPVVVSCFYLNEAPRNGPVQRPAYSILSKNLLCITTKQKNDVKSSSSVRMMAPASSSAQQSQRSTATTLRAMAEEYPLWERLGGGPGAKEAKWYIINCVATKEMDLLAQCRSATAEMSRDDVVKFVVPLERNTRSHGAKRIVTQNKVKYPGYVFAKLRLFAKTYETIQGLPLTRSWMGTISTTRRQPPIPMCLRKEEIEKFGLEELEETDLDALESHNRNNKQKMDKNGLMIIDDDVDDDDDEDGTDTFNVDLEALKVYEGLKVDDMVKVTSKEEAFFNEDGVIRRLNEGKIFVRFYTYGQLFEQWMGPKDVRKLKAEEILKGLTPSKPITQQDVDRLQDQRSGSGDNRFAPPSFAGNNRFGDRDQGRNRRQDRNEQRFLRSDNDRPGTEERENWRSYQDQQQRNSRSNDSFRDRDSARTSSPPGTRDWNSNSYDRGGRNTERYNSNNNNAFAGSSTARTFDRSNDRRDDNRRYGDNYERGNSRQRNDDDWNAFVSNREQGRPSRTPPPPPEQDDFFASLMKDLNKDVAGTGPDETHSRRQSSVGNTRNAPPKRRDDNEDDFFASLLNDLPQDSQAPPTRIGSDDRGRRNQSGSRGAGPNSAFDGDDFFATLEADLEKAVSTQQYSDAANSARGKGSDFTARGRSPERDSAPSPAIPTLMISLRLWRPSSIENSVRPTRRLKVRLKNQRTSLADLHRSSRPSQKCQRRPRNQSLLNRILV